MREKMLSYNDYKKMIREKLVVYLARFIPRFGEIDVDAYMEQESAFIRSEYDRDTKMYETGDLSYTVLLERPSTVAYCLDMMY